MEENASRKSRIGSLLRSRTTIILVLLTLLLGGVSIARATGDGTTDTTSDTTTESGTTTSESNGGITPEGGGGGNVNNEVVVLNTVDGRFANRAGFGTARVTGDTAENQNAAAATSSCSDCRTVAVAVQIVLIQRTDASNISPSNVAVAINNNCLRCDTFAAAYQYVITTDGLVRFTPEGEQQLSALQDEIRALAATDGVPFPELEAQIDARVEQMWAVVDSELAKVGKFGRGNTAKDTDAATEDSTPSPTASPSEPGSTVEDDGSVSGSSEVGTELEDTESPSPTPSPTSTATPAPTSSP